MLLFKHIIFTRVMNIWDSFFVSWMQVDVLDLSPKNNKNATKMEKVQSWNFTWNTYSI